MDIDKLEDIFRKRYRELCSEKLEDEEFFVNWCDRHKIIMLHPEWMVDSLNEGGMRGRVCINSPENTTRSSPWLLVPRKFAEKALVLGGLP